MNFINIVIVYLSLYKYILKIYSEYNIIKNLAINC